MSGIRRISRRVPLAQAPLKKRGKKKGLSRALKILRKGAGFGSGGGNSGHRAHYIPLEKIDPARLTMEMIEERLMGKAKSVMRLHRHSKPSLCDLKYALVFVRFSSPNRLTGFDIRAYRYALGVLRLAPKEKLQKDVLQFINNALFAK